MLKKFYGVSESKLQLIALKNVGAADPQSRSRALSVEGSRRRKERKAEGYQGQFAEVHAAAAGTFPPTPWCGGCATRIPALHWHCVGCGEVEEGLPARSSIRLGDVYQPLLYKPEFEGWYCGDCLRTAPQPAAVVPTLATAFQLWCFAMGEVGRSVEAALQATVDPEFAEWLEQHYGCKLTIP